MKNVESNAYLLNWGSLSVDSFNTKTKNATTILNFNFESAKNIENINYYSLGYAYWALKNLPKKSTITLIYDLKGLSTNENDLNKTENTIKNHIKSIDKTFKINIIFTQ